MSFLNKIGKCIPTKRCSSNVTPQNCKSIIVGLIYSFTATCSHFVILILSKSFYACSLHKNNFLQRREQCNDQLSVRMFRKIFFAAGW